MKNETYKQFVKDRMPQPNKLWQIIKAFVVGGGICVVAQLFFTWFKAFELSKEITSSITTMTMIAIGATLTGIGIYDRLGQFAGAGSLVPVTGFANAMVSPALEFKKEGMILGTAAKMFTIAGPVLVYGISTSVIIGLIYYIVQAVGA